MTSQLLTSHLFKEETMSLSLREVSQLLC
ncbi:MAG: transcriptional regulator, partial [Enterococcus faecalis]